MSKPIIKCKQYDLFNLGSSTGQIYFCTDTRILYKDCGNSKQQRKRLNAVVLNTEHERLNEIKPSLGRYYYVIESNYLWLFDTRWILQNGDTTKYNAYVNSYSTSVDGTYISPVIHKDVTITNEFGDRIIDNNGLLGDGSVAVRDENRIIRGTMNVDHYNQQVAIKSHLDNGLVFIPNAHLPYNDLNSSLGALHLTIDKNVNTTENDLNMIGQAYYYGTWNNLGNINILTKKDGDDYSSITYNIKDDEIIKWFIECHKTEIDSETNDEKTLKTHIIMRPLSTNEGIMQIISFYYETNDIVYTDLGEPLYTNVANIKENKIVPYTIQDFSDDDSIGLIECEYYINGVVFLTIDHSPDTPYDKTIRIKNEDWSDTEECDKFEIKAWSKINILDKINSLSNRIKELSDLLNSQKQ